MHSTCRALGSMLTSALGRRRPPTSHSGHDEGLRRVPYRSAFLSKVGRTELSKLCSARGGCFCGFAGRFGVEVRSCGVTFDLLCFTLPRVVMRNQRSLMGQGKSDEHPPHEELIVVMRNQRSLMGQGKCDEHPPHEELIIEPKALTGHDVGLHCVPNHSAFLSKVGRTELNKLCSARGGCCGGFAGRFGVLEWFSVRSHREDVAWSGGDAVPCVVCMLFVKVYPCYHIRGPTEANPLEVIMIFQLVECVSALGLSLHHYGHELIKEAYSNEVLNHVLRLDIVLGVMVMVSKDASEFLHVMPLGVRVKGTPRVRVECSGVEKAPVRLYEHPELIPQCSHLLNFDYCQIGVNPIAVDVVSASTPWTPTLIPASNDVDANFSDLHALQNQKFRKQGNSPIGELSPNGLRAIMSPHAWERSLSS
ncbi:hypothetical protein Taro_041301 [Colocasia esculenta]|uniref:Uncharacterized protein n=1 Tax=Colocasia esculenta TaxID=4460 RepID=A0A843WB48_COLES|nr:hypothetical protein [Colocasia esculenta]